MKVEDLPAIVSRELAKAGMLEWGFRDPPSDSRTFYYWKLRLLSVKKVDAKWHVTAGFEQTGCYIGFPNLHTVSLVIDDGTGEVTEMSTDGRG
jgi:hypothetical protein